MEERPVNCAAAASRRIVPDTRRRDTFIAVAVGLTVLAFIVWAVTLLGRQANASGGVEGTIIAKEFVAQPETQVTVGRGGVSSRQFAGEYILRVRVPSEGGKVYRVYVDQTVYEAKGVGAQYYLLQPK